MKLIDIKENQEFKLPVYVISSVEKKSKTGKSYLTGEVRDNSCVLKYNLWDTSNNFVTLPKTGFYYEFRGIAETFNGTLQINLKTATELEPHQINESDFKKTSSLNLEALWQEFQKIIASFQDEFVIALTKNILSENIIKKFKTAPAAEYVHNAWVGGLLEHSIAVAKLSDFTVNFYNPYFDNKLTRDIVVFGALFHDIGKIWEYDNDSPNIKTTKCGEFLGHIYMSTKKISDAAKEINNDKKTDDKLLKILHVILAHHGKYEWGAPVLPKIPEAIIVHYMDNIDAKIMNAYENLKDLKDEFAPKNFVQENARLYNVFLDEQ